MLKRFSSYRILPVTALWFLLLLLLLSGCTSAAPDVVPVPPVVAEPEPVEDRRLQTHVAGASLLEDGRMTGGFARGRIGEDLTNVFFSFRVDTAELAGEFDGNTASRRFVYLVVEVTVKNPFERPVTVWYDDFIVQWGDGDNDYGYPLEPFSDLQLDYENTLDEGESVTRYLVYEVPVPELTNEYGISYLEYFADDVEGNLFMVRFSLSM